MSLNRKDLYVLFITMLVLAVVQLACSVGSPASGGSTSAPTVAGQAMPPSVQGEATATTVVAPPPSGDIAALPTRDQLINGLLANGFIHGDNENHFTNTGLNMIAFLNNGCDFSIEIVFDPNFNSADQITNARQVLNAIYPAEVTKYFDKYIKRLSDNAINGGTALYAPSLSGRQFLVGITNELYTKGGLLFTVSNAGGRFYLP
jgi:hypothetical protein